MDDVKVGDKLYNNKYPNIVEVIQILDNGYLVRNLIQLNMNAYVVIYIPFNFIGIWSLNNG